MDSKDFGEPSVKVIEGSGRISTEWQTLYFSDMDSTEPEESAANTRVFLKISELKYLSK